MISATSPVASYLALSGGKEGDNVTRFRKTDAQTRADIAYFDKQAPKLTSPDALLKDYRSLRIVLTAFGLADQINSRALLKKLMTQDPAATGSLAAKSANATWQRFARAMNQWSSQPFASQSGIDAVATAYATNAFEAKQDGQAAGMQAALYFRRTAGSVTSLARLMSDATLLKVTVTAVGLPQQFFLLDYDQQVKVLGAKVKLSDFASAKKLDSMAERYLVQQQGTATAKAPTGIAALFASSGDGSLVSLFA